MKLLKSFSDTRILGNILKNESERKNDTMIIMIQNIDILK